MVQPLIYIYISTLIVNSPSALLIDAVVALLMLNVLGHLQAEMTEAAEWNSAIMIVLFTPVL